MTQQEGKEVGKDHPLYGYVHTWLCLQHNLKGSGKCCKHCGRKEGTGMRLEWALIHGLTYAKDIRHFIVLCASCHRKYDTTDATRKKMSNTRKGVPNLLNRRSVARIKEGKIDRVFPFISQAAKYSNVAAIACVNAYQVHRLSFIIDCYGNAY